MGNKSRYKICLSSSIILNRCDSLHYDNLFNRCHSRPSNHLHHDLYNKIHQDQCKSLNHVLSSSLRSDLSSHHHTQHNNHLQKHSNSHPTTNLKPRNHKSLSHRSSNQSLQFDNSSHPRTQCSSPTAAQSGTVGLWANPDLHQDLGPPLQEGVLCLSPDLDNGPHLSADPSL